MTEYCIKVSNDNPIAIAMGGRYDGKGFSIVKKGSVKDEDDERDPLEQLDISDFVDGFRLMDFDKRMRIVDSIRKGVPSKYKNKFDDCTTFKLDAGQFVLAPAPNTERVYIAGKSGVGKTSLAVMYAREYMDMFPDRKIVLISTHTDEAAYSSFDIVQVPLDDSFIENPPSLDVLSESLVIFDDADNLTNKKLQDAVRAVNNDLIANGRKYGIHVVTLAHQLMDYSRTRHLLNEANRVVFFLGGSAYHNKRYLKVYAGLESHNIQKIMALKSRWVCLGLTIPNYYVSQHEIGLLG